MTEVTERQNVNFGFDYSKLDDHVAEELKAKAQCIKREIASQTKSIIATGNMLIAAKCQVGHGSFARWVEAEIGVTLRTAENYVKAAKLASECKSEMISHLSPSTVYTMAAMPQNARLEALLKLEEAKELDVKAFEAKIRAACSRKNELALAGKSSEQRVAAEKIAGLLSKLLDPDHYVTLCKLIADLTGMGDPNSLRDVLRAVFSRSGYTDLNWI